MPHFMIFSPRTVFYNDFGEKKCHKVEFVPDPLFSNHCVLQYVWAQKAVIKWNAILTHFSQMIVFYNTFGLTTPSLSGIRPWPSFPYKFWNSRASCGSVTSAA